MRKLLIAPILAAIALSAPGLAQSLQASAQETTVFVPANQPPPGVDTGIDLTAGDKLTITASGRATYGFQGGECVGFPQTDPDGRRYLDGTRCPPKIDPRAILPTAPIGTLIGRIDGGPWFVIGSKYNKKVDTSGRLFLLYNEVIWHDDTGGYQVNVEVR
jgi:hypothetical protein